MISIISNASFNTLVIPTINARNPLFSFSPRIQLRIRKRGHTIQASSLCLPLLPFPIEQVLVPSESKTLHLYEARYLALLEESLFKNKLFVHVVLDPVVFGGVPVEGSFAARYGCLVTIEKVERLDIGALVLIRGIGRVKIFNFKQVQPYLTGEVTPLLDKIPQDMIETSSKVLELKESLLILNSLEIKLKASQEALLQTQSTNSLIWAEKKLPMDFIEAFIPLMAERVSFAGLQHVSGETPSELSRLQDEKLIAMDTNDTLQRLNISLKIVRENISAAAAKLAIQSLDVP